MTSLMKNMMHQLASQHKVPLKDMCETCGSKPKFVEKGHKHPYCSRSCARNSGRQAISSPPECFLHGCRAPGNPSFADFCSETHGREAVRLRQVSPCDNCHVLPRAGTGGDLCLQCLRQTRAQPLAPRLRELNKQGSRFREVRIQFTSQWSLKSKIPILEKVYEVILPQTIQRQYHASRSGLNSPQEYRTYHGSQCICDMGVNDAALCDFRSCGICSIIKSSFKSFAFGDLYNSGRFGEGIYSYKNPGRADYFATSCTSSPYRVMIACDVALRSNIQVSDDASIFVPSAETIIPVYVLMYSCKDGESE